jgi:hypothetical protein
MRDLVKNLFRIPDPGVKKTPDPGSATLIITIEKINTILIFKCHLGKKIRRHTSIIQKKMVVSVQEILSVFVRVGFLSCRYGTGNYEALIIFLKVRSSLTSHETKTRKFSYIT